VSATRFQSDIAALGGTIPGVVEFGDLAAAYSEPHRHYHTLAHIDACLAALDAYRTLAVRPAEIAVALWFHDVVYDTHRDDNEAMSAAWAARCLRKHRVAAGAVARIERMILATRHTTSEVTGDTALLVDIDLGILGQPARVFDRYDAGIRREYAWVAEDAYRTGRRRVLESFLGRARIYTTDTLHEALDHTARGNLERALGRLAR
jgi:predicted metal-dependent HD superfamily phosphohydrolase